jgi:hypothetical protein
MKRPAQFLAQGRTLVILHAFGSLLMLLSAMIVTISGERFAVRSAPSLPLIGMREFCKGMDRQDGPPR